ncbi:MAG: hypothetical protein DKT66_28235 [Candidatus Melainabacteria bacterium]|nr:MAG: hypothetical protein DKT66_28235 [Candidatus Melainabacteria bacterium]
MIEKRRSASQRNLFPLTKSIIENEYRFSREPTKNSIITELQRLSTNSRHAFLQEELKTIGPKH